MAVARVLQVALRVRTLRHLIFRFCVKSTDLSEMFWIWLWFGEVDTICALYTRSKIPNNLTSDIVVDG